MNTGSLHKGKRKHKAVPKESPSQNTQPCDCPYNGLGPHLILGCIADEPLSVSEGDIARRCPVPLVVSDDFNLEK
jgi:hypothetical protein